jgi:hypothetical protein
MNGEAREREKKEESCEFSVQCQVKVKVPGKADENAVLMTR